MSEKATQGYKSRVEYAVTDASQKTYSFPFQYLKKEFIKVQKLSKESTLTDLTYGVDYIVSDLTIILTGYVSFAAGDTLVIYRETTTTSIVTWSDASILLSKDMSLEQYQTLHLIEEAEDYIIQNIQASADLTQLVDIAQQWAEGAYSPDGEPDEESPTRKTQSSRSWSLYSKDRALAAEKSAENLNDAVSLAQQAATIARDNANSVQDVLEKVQDIAKNVNVFIPDMDENGTLTWSNKAGLLNPDPVNLKGPKGDTGAQGPKGDKGDKGNKGDKGDTGESGVQIETNAFCLFSVRDGHLICTYQDGQEQPNFSINENGHLIYTIE